MEIKLDGRLLSLSLVIFIFFAVLESSANNFYPLRYGKRDNRDEGRFLRGSRYDRRSGENTFYGSRYGKRSPSETPENVPDSPRPSYKSYEFLPMSSVEYGTPVIRDRYERSPESRNKFYFGPRFGKRDGYQSGKYHVISNHESIKAGKHHTRHGAKILLTRLGLGSFRRKYKGHVRTVRIRPQLNCLPMEIDSLSLEELTNRQNEGEQILCRHTGLRDLYDCLEEVF